MNNQDNGTWVGPSASNIPQTTQTIAIDMGELVRVISVAIDEIKATIQSQNSKMNRIILSVNELMGVIEKLGKTHNLDYSNDLKDWVNQDKLAELKQNPR